MIHIFSSEFSTDKLNEVELSILIEDRCRLKLHTVNKNRYFFTGESDWITSVCITKEDVDKLKIEEYVLLDNFIPTPSSKVEVVFYDLLSRLLPKDTFMTYFEVDLNTLKTSATRVWCESHNELTCTAEDDLFDAVYNAQ